jgi:hypothetical protein
MPVAVAELPPRGQADGVRFRYGSYDWLDGGRQRLPSIRETGWCFFHLVGWVGCGSVDAEQIPVEIVHDSRHGCVASDSGGDGGRYADLPRYAAELAGEDDPRLWSTSQVFGRVCTTSPAWA